MKITVFLLCAALLSFDAPGQCILTGKIVDSEHRAIANAHVFPGNADTILVSDTSGRFHIALNSGNLSITITHIEYDTLFDFLELDGDTSLIFVLKHRNIEFDAVTIYGIKSTATTPLAYTEIDGEALNENNYGQDMPVLLQNTVSAVATSDAGNGVGYTGIRIRGSDATRINITINGVPFNDAESAQSYWVDIPDIALAADAVQVQRGIGFSTNGSGVFGASVNLFTNHLQEEAGATLSTSFGSFELFRSSLRFATGRMKNHWFLEGSASYIDANGFIERSFANLRSGFFTAGYQSNNYKSVLNIIGGKEKTYQSWGGVPKDSLETNRNFNPYTYANQTDNYTQTHVQWHHHFFFNNNGNWNITFNYTAGNGYYEQLEQQQDLLSYGINPVEVNDSVMYLSDMITQKWLSNDFYGIITDYNWLTDAKNKIVLGGAYFKYFGRHFDEIIWTDYGAVGVPPFRYSDNDAVKQDGNTFVQWHVNPSDKLEIISDVQWRYVSYRFTGFDAELQAVPQTQRYNFINPKIGIFWTVNRNLNAYTYWGYTSKEPNRDDFVNSSVNSRPQPEHLMNIELGIKSQIDGWRLQPNIYYMYYRDQLVLDGRINDVGEYTRVNVPVSYRAGLELSVSKQFGSLLEIALHGSFGESRIRDYTHYIDDWDSGNQIAETYKNTSIAFSPRVTGGLVAEYKMVPAFTYLNAEWNLYLDLTSRYVGRQYIDNTQTSERSLDPYPVSDLGFRINCITPGNTAIDMRFLVSNLFDASYESNAWVYPYYYEGRYREMNGYFPQAGRAYYVKLSLSI